MDFQKGSNLPPNTSRILAKAFFNKYLSPPDDISKSSALLLLKDEFAKDFALLSLSLKLVNNTNIILEKRKYYPFDFQYSDLLDDYINNMKKVAELVSNLTFSSAILDAKEAQDLYLQNNKSINLLTKALYWADINNLFPLTPKSSNHTSYSHGVLYLKNKLEKSFKNILKHLISNKYPNCQHFSANGSLFTDIAGLAENIFSQLNSNKNNWSFILDYGWQSFNTQNKYDIDLLNFILNTLFSHANKFSLSNTMSNIKISDNPVYLYVAITYKKESYISEDIILSDSYLLESTEALSVINSSLYYDISDSVCTFNMKIPIF